jgi:predicted nicotinamide N-methyase
MPAVARRRAGPFKAGAAGALLGILLGRRVCAADIDPLAEVAAGINAGLNGVEIETTTSDLLGGKVSGFEVILLGDMFYEADAEDDSDGRHFQDTFVFTLRRGL